MLHLYFTKDNTFPALHGGAELTDGPVGGYLKVQSSRLAFRDSFWGAFLCLLIVPPVFVFLLGLNHRAGLPSHGECLAGSQ